MKRGPGCPSTPGGAAFPSWCPGRGPRAASGAAPGGAGETREEERAYRLLSIGTPAEVLASIVPEDPLGLRPRLGAHLARLALLLDAERLLLRCQALCALHAPLWRGVPRLEAWLEERVVEAVAGTLSEEGESEAALGGAFEPFAAPLALDPEALGQACARFNRLPVECREAFFVLVLEADGVLEGERVGADRLARARGLSLSELARRARVAIELFRAGVAATPAPPRPTRVGEGRS